MARLVATSALEGLLPLSAEETVLSEVSPGPIASVAAYRGRAKDVSAALKAAVGVGLPAPNRTQAKGGVRAVWTARDQAFVLGAAVGLGVGLVASITGIPSCSNGSSDCTAWQSAGFVAGSALLSGALGWSLGARETAVYRIEPGRK